MQKSFDEYIEEMMRMYRSAAKKQPEQAEKPKAIAIPLAKPEEPIPKSMMPKHEPLPILPAPNVADTDSDTAALPEMNVPKPPKEEIAVIPLPPAIEPNTADGSGKLIIKVTTARGMLPVADAAVTVSRTAQNGGGEVITLQTDSSGNTPEITLPAPPKYKSEAPLPPDDMEEVMAKYDIAVSAEGYADAFIKGAAVFDGVTSIQNIELLTDSAANSGEAMQ